MRVHNLYSDILLSLSYFLNKILDGQIKNFQYNISSTSFNLNYNANYELPAAVITYNNSSYLNARPSTFLSTISNYNQILVLYDINKQIGLSIQEDHFIISIDASINCDSQLQIIDFKHKFESIMPLNKYLQVYKFVSYFEIDSEFINPYLFDVSRDKIENLFFRHNEATDELKHCFSVGYEPLIKLTNTSINISEVSASTFSLILSFELLMQLPSKLLFNYESLQQRQSNFDDIKHLKFDNIIVPLNSKYEYINIKLKNKAINNIFNINCPCIKNLDQFKLYGEFKNELLTLSINTDALESHYIANVYGIIENKVIDNCRIKYQSGELNGKYGYIVGNNINGKLKNIEIIDNKLYAWFDGEFYGKLASLKFDSLDYEFISEYFDIKSPNISIDSNYTILNYRFIESGNIFSAIKTISSFKSEIDFRFTKISAVSFYDIESKTYLNLIDLPNEIDILENGEFSFEILNHSIKGSINNETGHITTNIKNLNDSLDSLLELHEFKLNLVFKYYPIRGPNRIQQINIDFRLSNEVISDISPVEINNYSVDKYNLVIDKLNISEKDASNRYTITIPLPFYFNGIPKDFKIFFTRQKYLTDETKLEFIIDNLNSSPSYLILTTTEQMYFKYLVYVNKIHPIFFSTSFLR